MYLLICFAWARLCALYYRVNSVSSAEATTCQPANATEVSTFVHLSCCGLANTAAVCLVAGVSVERLSCLLKPSCRQTNV